MGSTSRASDDGGDIPTAVWGVVELVSRELQAKKEELLDAKEKLQLLWTVEAVSILICADSMMR